MKITAVNEKVTKFSDVFTFMQDVPELKLVDIINNASYTSHNSNFI